MLQLLEKFFALFGAYEPKTRAFIITLISAIIVIPYFMFQYFNSELDKRDKSITEIQIVCKTQNEIFTKKLEEANLNTLNEVKNCQIELLALIREVNNIKQSIRKKDND